MSRERRGNRHFRMVYNIKTGMLPYCESAKTDKPPIPRRRRFEPCPCGDEVPAGTGALAEVTKAEKKRPVISRYR